MWQLNSKCNTSLSIFVQLISELILNSELKHEPALWNDDDGVLNRTSKGTNTHSSQGLFISSAGGAGNLSFEDSVKEAMDYLVRHRKNEKRPETLEVTTFVYSNILFYDILFW